MNNIKFADDSILIANCLEDLQQILDIMVEASEETELSLYT